MSYLLMIIYWVGIPLLVLLATGWALRQAKTKKQKKWIFATTAVVLLGLLWAAGGEKAMVDAQVRKLCAQDGGVRVYETVTLPKEKFDKWGNVGLSSKIYAKSTDEYYYEFENHYIREGDPTLVRSKTKIVRRSDKKVLGESIRYGRGGGDLPGPWHPSSYDCPLIENLRLEASIFVKGDSK